MLLIYRAYKELVFSDIKQYKISLNETKEKFKENKKKRNREKRKFSTLFLCAKAEKIICEEKSATYQR